VTFLRLKTNLKSSALSLMPIPLNSASVSEMLSLCLFLIFRDSIVIGMKLSYTGIQYPLSLEGLFLLHWRLLSLSLLALPILLCLNA